MSKKITICKHCNGKAEWWDEKEGYSEMTDGGRVKRSWITRYHQCLELDCKEKLDLGSREHKEKDTTYYSNEERRVYKR